MTYDTYIDDRGFARTPFDQYGACPNNDRLCVMFVDRIYTN